MILEQLLDRPIAYHRCFVPIAGVSGAILLSQALYWSNRTNDSNGWFYKTREEWQEETGLGRSAQENARSKLIEAGVIEEKLSGVPAKLYFRVNLKALSSWLLSDQLDGRKVTNKLAENLPTTTETTTYTTSIKEKSNKKEKKPTEEENTSLSIVGSSKNSIIPLTDLERWELATELNIQLWAVKETEEAFWEYVEEPKNLKKYKTSYKTVKKWLQMALQKGQYQYNNEVEIMMLQSQHPDLVKENEEIRRISKEKGWID